MKNQFLKIIAVIFFLNVCIFNSIYAQQEVFPTKTQFNATEAKQLLDYGNKTIKGIAFTREYSSANGINSRLGINVVGKKHYAAEGTKVLLFPVNAYFEEYLKLRSKYKKSNRYRAFMSKEAFSYRIEALVGKEGAFTFKKMKPGKYYLEVLVNFKGTGVESEELSRTDFYNGYGNYQGSSSVYNNYYVNYNGAKLETKTIEIKEDDTIVEIKL